MEKNIAAAVLIGGHSRRMGRPKENIVIEGDGRTFMDKICDEVDKCFGTCIKGRYISVRKGQQAYRNGFTVVEDIYDDIGPAGGLISVLKRAISDGYNAVLLLACDMIKYNSTEIERICAAYPGEGIMYARSCKEHIQPLASIYGIDAFCGIINCLEKENYRLRDVGAGCCRVEYYDTKDPAAYVNINRERDVMAVERKELSVIKLVGRISSSNASEEEERILNEIAGCPEGDIVFDASELEYISSAGLRVLMKVKKQSGREVKITEVSQEVYDILETTGFTEILSVSKKMRSVDVSGCEVIGNGFYGTVYRLNEDTIIKVYKTPDSLPMIENEKKMAKLAFIKGIPTAISYDIVRVGNSFGSVFELLNAKTFNDLIISDPGHADEIIRRYVDFIKLVHDTKAEYDELPSAKEAYLAELDEVKEYLDDGQYEGIKDIIARVDEEKGVVHGDFQMKNVMYVDDEPMLIDMDTLSRGDPVFDLAGLYVTYKAFEEDEPENSMNFLGISNEMADHIWDKLMRYYFETEDEDELRAIGKKIRIAASVRFLYIVTQSDLKNSELGSLRIRHTREHIDELLGEVDDIACRRA